MAPKAFFVPVLLILAGCVDSAAEEPVDFGARFVARHIVDAQKKCAAIDLPDLLDCADQPSKGPARTAARIANDVYASFKDGCYGAAGRDKCEDLMASAYAQASAARPSQLVSAPAPGRDRPAGP